MDFDCTMSDNQPIQKLVIETVAIKEEVATEIQNKSSQGVNVVEEIVAPLVNESTQETVKEAVNKVIEEKPESNTLPIQDLNNSNTNPIQSNNLITDVETLKMIKGLNFWAKFMAVWQFIGAGFLIVSGLIYVITIIFIPLSLIYWVIGGLSIWIAFKLLKATNKFNNLSKVSNQEGFNSNVLQGMNELKSYFKIQGILTIVGIALFFLAILLVIIFGASSALFFNEKFNGVNKYPTNYNSTLDSLEADAL
jgi:hypothetical protein